MERGQEVTSPDGDHWRVRRRWMDRPMPNLRKRSRRNREESDDSSLLDLALLPDFFDGLGGLVLGIAFAFLIVLVIVVLLPLIGVLLELLLLALLLGSGIAGRVVLRRPWIVEAVNLDDAERSVAYGVKGFRQSGRAVEELATALQIGGTPDRLAAGAPVPLPRPGAPEADR